jgi:hypothetical protein
MPTGFRSTFSHLLRGAWLAGAAGGLAGLLIGGVGGRIAMLILRLTSKNFVRGAQSDDGFTIGRFSMQTGFLLIVTAALGSVAALIYMTLRPALPPRGRRAIWATLCGAIGGAGIIHTDGVDFNLLEPAALAIAMFIAIPAAGGWLTAYLIDRWEPWWTTNRRGTVLASIPMLPLIGLAIGVVAVIAATAVVASLAQISVVRRGAEHVAVRAAVWLALAGVTLVALVDLSDDATTLL